MNEDHAARARQREVVRRGYDAISYRYRTDDGEASDGTAETTARYAAWIDELATLLPSQGRVLDLGCGAGVPAARLLVQAGFDVVGVDFSPQQIARAQVLVPDAEFACCDLVDFSFGAATFDAIVSLYALIHVPLADQRAVLTRCWSALRPGGYLLAIVGYERWTGVEEYLGAPMFWDHADEATYLGWLAEDGFEIRSSRFVPEGASGHTLVLARRPA